MALEEAFRFRARAGRCTPIRRTKEWPMVRKITLPLLAVAPALNLAASGYLEERLSLLPILTLLSEWIPLIRDGPRAERGWCSRRAAVLRT